MGNLIYLRDVVTLRLDQEKCVGCGTCLAVCPHQVLAMNNGCASIERKDRCMECGACARNCPVEAVVCEGGSGMRRGGYQFRPGPEVIFLLLCHRTG